ncbi:MAG: hypothetical protein NC910_03520 [Candidatus Omnitrophica bacterium]|nr:hypothetical protein [Candidatus Omnitrophota bacterium]
MKRVLLVFAVLLCLGVLAAGALLYWVTTPGGASWISLAVSSRVQEQVPETKVEIRRLRFVPHFKVEAISVNWKTIDGTRILSAGSVLLQTDPRRWIRGDCKWAVQVRQVELDLAALDRTVGKGEWKAAGLLRGAIDLEGTAGAVERVETALKADDPGGTLSGELMRQLLSFMPEGDARRQLLTALKGQELFHYQVGKIDVRTDESRYLVDLYLDGDHLLNLKIRVDKESVAVLKELIL